MNDSNADDRCDTGNEEGFAMFYRCGDYRTNVTFDSGDCHSVVANIVNFLLGCGFSPNNVIDCMAESAASLEDAWFNPQPASMDEEILRKWHLSEKMIPFE
jgi:hypothetical protein